MKNWRPVFYGLAALWLLIGLGSGNRIIFVLLAVQILLFLAALTMNLWAAFSFTFLQELSADQTLRGRPVHLKLVVHNEKAVPYPLMRIRLATAAWNEPRQLDFNLAAHSQLAFDLALECPHRGEYLVGMTIIDFIDIFGILRLPFDMRLLPYYRLNKLLVYPQLTDLADLALPALDRQRFSRRQFATENLDEPFSTVRSYKPGDPRKLIHWKLSQRQQKLFTRVFDRSAEPQILILLDLSCPEATGEAARQIIDVCCECAVSLVHYLLQQFWLLQIVSFGAERLVQTGSGLQDFQHFYNWLARVPFDGQLPFHQQLAAELGRHQGVPAILLITADLNPQLLNVLTRFRQDRKSINTLFTGSARNDAAESIMADLMNQAGLPAWFIHYGENLADQLKGRP
jgi:uncharacterized protein (DUF58 family)